MRSIFFVNEQQLRTAEGLAAMVSTKEEIEFARQARQLADADVSLSFEIALRQAESQPVEATPELRALQARAGRAATEVQKDTNIVSLLEKRVAAAGDHTSNNLQEELDLAKAQLNLSQDELSDARQEFQLAGGDLAERIRRQFERYELSRQDADSSRSVSTERKSSPIYGASNLVAQVIAWYDLRGKPIRLESARSEANSTVAVLQMNYGVLAGSAEVSSKLRTRHTPGESNQAEVSASAKTEYLKLLKLKADDEKSLTGLQNRIEGQKELSGTYERWLGFVANHKRAELHGILASVLWILIVIQAIRFSEPLSQRLLRKLVSEESKRTAYRTAIRFALQALGILLVIMVIFGIPSDLPPAILGIVGAALAVILKDFTVSFFDSRIRGIVAAYYPSNPSK